MNYVKVFTDYLQSEKGASSHTVRAYIKNLTEFLEYLNGKDVKSVTHHDIKAYIKHCVQELGNSKVTSNRKRSVLSTFFRMLQRDYGLETNPVDLVETQKVGKKLPKALSRREVEALLEAATRTDTPDRDYLIVDILYSTGLRVSELCALHTNDLPTSPEEPFLGVTGKGDKDRVTALYPDLIKRLTAYVGGRRGYVFHSWGTETGYIDDNTIRELMKRLARDAGIPEVKVSPHKLRHSYATHLLDEGADIKAIQEMLGHSSLATTQIYTEASRKKIKDTAMLHPRSKETLSR